MLRRLNYPPVWLGACMLLTWWLAQVIPHDGADLTWIGRVLVVAGLVLAGWAVWQFSAAGTTVIPHEEPSALVESGPYRFSRNPIYVADLIILAGWSLALQTLMGLFLLLPLQIALERLFIRPEEERLERVLGAPYAAYKARVRRWI